MRWVIDPAHSTVEFKAKHMMFTTVRGHFGSFEGTLNLDTESPADSYVEGTVDIDSINSGDEQRDTHLRGPDFFDIENHPKMTFRSTRIEPIGDNEYKVHGKLTIRGTTRDVVWHIEAAELGKDPWGNPRLGFSAETSIDRRDFGLTWNVPLESGGFLVSNKIDIEAEVQAVPSTEDIEETVEAEMATSTR